MNSYQSDPFRLPVPVLYFFLAICAILLVSLPYVWTHSEDADIATALIVGITFGILGSLAEHKKWKFSTAYFGVCLASFALFFWLVMVQASTL